VSPRTTFSDAYYYGQDHTGHSRRTLRVEATTRECRQGDSDRAIIVKRVVLIGTLVLALHSDRALLAGLLPVSGAGMLPARSVRG
jgi:hypothetical protein